MSGGGLIDVGSLIVGTFERHLLLWVIVIAIIVQLQQRKTGAARICEHLFNLCHVVRVFYRVGSVLTFIGNWREVLFV